MWSAAALYVRAVYVDPGWLALGGGTDAHAARLTALPRLVCALGEPACRSCLKNIRALAGFITRDDGDGDVFVHQVRGRSTHPVVTAPGVAPLTLASYIRGMIHAVTGWPAEGRPRGRAACTRRYYTRRVVSRRLTKRRGRGVATVRSSRRGLPLPARGRDGGVRHRDVRGRPRQGHQRVGPRGLLRAGTPDDSPRRSLHNAAASRFSLREATPSCRGTPPFGVYRCVVHEGTTGREQVDNVPTPSERQVRSSVV